jgi:voltage-gated potassium channel
LDFTLTFIEVFGYVAFIALPLLVTLSLLVALMGLVVARIESWTPFVGIYWAYITATTVGYGDVRAQHRRSRVLSVLIAFTGILFTGIFVSIAVEAASVAYSLDPQLPEIRAQLEEFKLERAGKTSLSPLLLPESSDSGS